MKTSKRKSNQSNTKTQNVLDAKLNESEKKALEKWRKSDSERVGPVKFERSGDRNIVNIEKEKMKFMQQVVETSGSTDIDFFNTLISQVGSFFKTGKIDEDYNFITSLMHGLKPNDETEGVLIAQMAGTHILIMEFMKRAIHPDQYLEAGNDYTNRASRLMNIFIKQLEILQKYRGKSAQQKMVVEHVHIHEGGQAVVGQVNTKSRGDGDESKK